MGDVCDRRRRNRRRSIADAFPTPPCEVRDILPADPEESRAREKNERRPVRRIANPLAPYPTARLATPVLKKGSMTTTTLRFHGKQK